jgi:serine/threonine protein kinase
MAVREEGRAGVALLIGIGEYLQADRVGTLRFATHDARALAEVLVDPDMCGFPPDRVLLLTGAQAGRDELVRRLSKWLPETARGAEIVFLSFAGHGAVQRVGQRDEGFLLPYDADPEDLVTRGIAMSDLGRWIEGIEAETVVVCLDCCHAARVLVRQGGAATVEVRDMKIRPSLLQGLSGKGRHLFASCDEGQVSVEVEPLGHGLFTYHLLRGLRGDADRDGDGRVGVAELFEFVAAAVERDAKQLGHVQKPWNHSTGPGGVYLSRPGARRGPPDVLATIGPPSGPAEAAAMIEEAGRALHGTDTGRIHAALEWFRRAQSPEALPGVFKTLTHASPAVRERAKETLQAIGWKRTAALVEDLARGTESGSFGDILDGLAAFEAHRDVVALLDRLVSLLRGDLRNRAILLLERKRLALGLEDVSELFRELHSPYRLEKVLGQGLFTAAYLARDEQTDLEVTVRVLRPEYVAMPQVRAQFLDLGRKAVRLVHQNLVLTREVRAVPDRQIYFMVRDYVDGITLQRLLESGKAFTSAQILTIVRQVLQALTPLHATGWPHGGIKPSNVFLCGHDRVILGDPVLSVREISLASRRLSYDYRYAAPEQFRDDGIPGTTADFYAVGCLAHELACGAPPFVSDNPHVLASLHVHEPVEAPSRRGSRLEVDGDPFLLRLLAKSAAERYASIEDALGAIVALSRPPAPRVAAAPFPAIPSRDKSHRKASREARPLVGEESLVRYDRDQSIVPFDPKSIDTAGSVAPGPAAPPAEREIDQIGPYVVQGLIGVGGMGGVYLAMDTRLQRQVAIKVIRKQNASDAQSSARFLREAQAIARMSHPNIVSIHSVGEQGGSDYIVLEYVEGGTLRSWITERALPLESAVDLMIQVARAVHYAHERGILHRDLKPSNILLTKEGVPKIADFGLAKLLDDRPDDVAATHQGVVLGTPAYMAPEQALGRLDQVGPATDIYSLGGIFYEMLTAHRPFEGGTALGMMHQVLHQVPDPPSRFRPDLPRELDAICLKCLSKPPEARYPSAAALAEDLERFQRGESLSGEKAIPAPPPPRRHSLWRRLFSG